MAISRINNQAVKMYTLTETRHNQKSSQCEWHLDYFPLATCDDVSEIVFDTSVSSANIGNDLDFDTNVTGTATSASVNKLIDSGADFDGSIGTGDPIITTAMRVHNTTDNTSAGVVSVDSASQLTLDADIFPLGTEGYSISFYETTGNFAMGTGEMVKTAGAVGTFAQQDILTEDDLFKVSITITSFTNTTDGDGLTFKIGGVTVLELDETDTVAATHTFYGYAPTAADLSVEVSADSTVQTDISQLEISQMSNASFEIRECDDDTVVYSSISDDITTSTSSNQIKLSVDWSNVADGYTCLGCYYIYVTDGTNTFRSDCFQLDDSHACTVKLSGTNLDNAFGIDFIGLAYSPFVRITGELEFPKYDGDKENEEDSAGVSKTLYYKSEKRRNLFIWQQPEYIHDFIRLLKGYDTFQVDGVDYVAKDANYSPEAERLAGKLPDLANSTIDVRLKTDLNENKFC